MPRVVVVGSVNLDLVYRVPHLPRPGETLLGADLHRLPGGKGGNQAFAAARVAASGVTVAFVGCVGDDEAGRLLRDDLSAAGVDVGGAHVVSGPSGTALIAVDDVGENTIVVIPGANHRWPEDAVARLDVAAGDVVVLQLEIPLEIAEAVAARATEAGARVVLNAAPADARAAALARRVDVLVVNEVEAAELLGVAIPVEAAGLAAALDGAAAAAGGAVVVTLGARGALVALPGAPVRHVPAVPVDAVDSVGAGDAFVGAFAAALAAGEPPEAAVRRGAVAGAITATVVGARATALSRDDVERRVTGAP